MARAGSTRQVDEQAVERESPVRQAHASQARQHGRSSAPGYLGVPLEQAPDEPDREASEQDDEEGQAGKSRAREPRTRTRGGSDRTRKPSQGARAEDGTGDAPAGKQPGAGQQHRGGSSGARKSSRGKGAGATTQPRSSSRPAKSKAARGQSGKRAAPKATKPQRSARSGGSGAGSKAKPRRAAGAAKHGAGKAAGKAASVASGGKSAAQRRARKEARKAAGGLARKALIHAARGAARTAARVARNAGEAGLEAVSDRARRLPIQRSVDVAVPVEIAWQQWLEFEHLPEGTNRVSEVERDGDTLTGRLEGMAGGDWEAEVLDEREHESFAWRSTEGSDSAGLVTFHRLSDRLTRLELELDIRPTHLVEAATLAAHIADRRVEAELRSFKAEAELLNPDIYDDLLSPNGSGDNDEQ